MKKPKRTVAFSGWLTKPEAKSVEFYANDGESLGQTIRRLVVRLCASGEASGTRPSSSLAEPHRG